MRQFLSIIAASYLLVGIGAGLVYYQEGARVDDRQAAADRLAAEAVTAGLLWPIHIADLLARHDARKLS